MSTMDTTNPEDMADDERRSMKPEAPAPAPPLLDVDFAQHKRIAEALLFAAPQPLSVKILTERLPEGARVQDVLDSLKEDYARRGIRLSKAGDGYAFRTAPDLGEYLTLHKTDQKRLSRAAVETLAIIAYHQPVTRAEVEDIRGVALSKGTLDILLEANWIKPRGRRQSPGRPLTWGTTDAFLDHFGLESLKDLPGIADLKAAGLLDTRPALSAYGARANDDGVLPYDTEEEETLDDMRQSGLDDSGSDEISGHNAPSRASDDLSSDDSDDITHAD